MFGDAVAAGLTFDGYRVRQIVLGPATRRIQSDRFEAQLTCEKSLAELHHLLTSDGDRIGAIVNFLPTCTDLDAAGVALATFNIVKQFQADLKATVDAGGGRLMNVTEMDGQFGLRSQDFKIAGAGSVGVCKSLHREVPKLLVKNIDVDPATPPQIATSRLLNEFGGGLDELEIGLDQDGRWRLVLQAEAPPPSTSKVTPRDHQIVMVTGGAYGITAESTKQLAREGRHQFILVGRSPEPVAADENAGRDAAALRRLYIEEMRATGERMAPAEIEKRVQRTLKNNKIRENLAELRRLGSSYEYHSLDVRDMAALAALVDDVYERHGRLDGVIHGAGVIDDKLITDKTPAAFDNVFRTKVDSANVLATKLRPESLRYLVFFSSVSGRF